MHHLKDRIIGTLLGLAAGDRIGGPTRMAFQLATCLNRRDGFEVADAGLLYLQWWRAGGFDTGPITDRVLFLVDRWISFEQAARQADAEAGGLTAGCNPAHRCAPLAMCSLLPDAGLGQLAMAEARLTHQHPLAGDAASAVTCLCRALIRGEPWPVALAVAAVARHPETCQALTPQPFSELSRSGFATDALAAAVHFVNDAADFSEALERSIAFAGPSNYCPVLVGSIAGARWGRSQITPVACCHHGPLIPELTSVAQALVSKWSSDATASKHGLP